MAIKSAVEGERERERETEIERERDKEKGGYRVNATLWGRKRDRIGGGTHEKNTYNAKSL